MNRSEKAIAKIHHLKKSHVFIVLIILVFFQNSGIHISFASAHLDEENLPLSLNFGTTVYLPLIQKLVEVHPFTLSRYVGRDEYGIEANVNNLPNMFFNMGCKSSTTFKNGSSGYLYLDFGQPWIKNEVLGVRIFDKTYAPTFLPLMAENNEPSVELISKQFINGVVSCGYTLEKDFFLRLVVGINNDKGNSEDPNSYSALNYAHGEALGHMIENLNNYSSSSAPIVFVRAGMDMELKYSQPEPVKDWIQGLRTTDTLLILFPACEGCPTETSNTLPYPNWTVQDIYDLVRNNSSMPQIYDIDGINAHQWNWMTVGLPQQNNIPVAYLLGTLTQWDACSFWSNTREECVIQRTYNKPEDAMTDLAYLQRPYLFDYQSDMSWDDCTLDDCVWTPNWLP